MSSIYMCTVTCQQPQTAGSSPVELYVHSISQTHLESVVLISCRAPSLVRMAPDHLGSSSLWPTGSTSYGARSGA